MINFVALAVSAEQVLALTTPTFPPSGWWVAGLVLFVLGLAAAIDAYTSTVPDPLIFAGLLAVMGLQGLYVGWPAASAHLTAALGALFLIWAVNELWFSFFKADALGMGDGKWTMLAVACFGVFPVLFAWGVGAVLASCWILMMRLGGFRITRVHFAPFLFIGLIAALYVFRVRGAL